MIKLLPFIVIPILIVIGLGYWRYIAVKPDLATSQIATQQTQGLVEVPKTLPNATLEDRVKTLEDTNQKLVTELNALKASSPQNPSSSIDSRLMVAESSVTDLKARVSVLEKGTVATAPSTGTFKQATAYIPLGSGGGGGNKDWTSIANYGVGIDPVEYPGYSTMQLEVNFRLTQLSGTAYVRFYDVTDSSAKELVTTTSDSFSWQTSYGFTLPAGKKTYTLQIKSTEGVEIQIQSARIKVNF